MSDYSFLANADLADNSPVPLNRHRQDLGQALALFPRDWILWVTNHYTTNIAPKLLLI
ncbi:MAG: hypothetical protein ACK5QS_04800 [Pseudanabaenaceae cyanobacterium]